MTPPIYPIYLFDDDDYPYVISSPNGLSWIEPTFALYELRHVFDSEGVELLVIQARSGAICQLKHARLDQRLFEELVDKALARFCGKEDVSLNSEMSAKLKYLRNHFGVA